MDLELGRADDIKSMGAPWHSQLMPPGPPIFERVIKAWLRHPLRLESLTLNQIAHIALGSGTASNSAVVGRMINEFRQYFHSQGGKESVNWAATRRDYPELCPDDGSPAPAAIGPPLDGMVRALDGELAAPAPHELTRG